jgi:hypothetical protein
MQDVYAQQEAMTDVVIKFLNGQSQARLKCGEYVHQVSVFGQFVAVQSRSGITVYEQDRLAGQYIVKGKLPGHDTADSLAISASHIVVCKECRLHSFGFSGTQCVARMFMNTNEHYTCLGTFCCFFVEVY